MSEDEMRDVLNQLQQLVASMQAAGEGGQVWVDRTGVSFLLIEAFAGLIVRQTVEKIGQGTNVDDALKVLVATTFSAAYDYGQTRMGESADRV